LSESFVLKDKKISFLKPNIISIFVSVSQKELEISQNLYKTLIEPKLLEKNEIEFIGGELTDLYNYFERIQSSIVSIYTAIEALSNLLIPRDYKIERKNNKGVLEIWNKDSIERWMKTSEKIGDIIPGIIHVRSLKENKIWNYFKELENIRNDIIHPKTSEDQSNVETVFLKKLIDKKIFLIIESGFTVIKYFCEMDKENFFLPFGFAEVIIKPYEIDDFDEYFEPIE